MAYACFAEGDKDGIGFGRGGVQFGGVCRGESATDGKGGVGRRRWRGRAGAGYGVGIPESGVAGVAVREVFVVGAIGRDV